MGYDYLNDLFGKFRKKKTKFSEVEKRATKLLSKYASGTLRQRDATHHAVATMAWRGRRVHPHDDDLRGIDLTARIPGIGQAAAANPVSGQTMKSTPMFIRKADAAFSPCSSTFPVSFLARNLRKSFPSFCCLTKMKILISPLLWSLTLVFSLYPNT